MRAVTQAMLEGMPDPRDLHLERSAGRCAVMVGSAVLAEYAECDVVMRNFAVTTVRRAGFAGKRVAEVFGMSAAYVSTLHAAAACGVSEGCLSCELQQCPLRELGGRGIMMIHVRAPALSHLRPGLRLADTARPLDSLQGRRAARAAARCATRRC
jgi:hypothetical protein